MAVVQIQYERHQPDPDLSLISETAKSSSYEALYYTSPRGIALRRSDSCIEIVTESREE